MQRLEPSISIRMNKDRGHQLLFLPCNDFSDHVQRIIIGVDPEQAEDPG